MIKAQASGQSKVPAGTNNRIEKRIKPMTNRSAMDIMKLISPIVDEIDLTHHLKLCLHYKFYFFFVMRNLIRNYDFQGLKLDLL